MHLMHAPHVSVLHVLLLRRVSWGVVQGFQTSTLPRLYWARTFVGYGSVSPARAFVLVSVEGNGRGRRWEQQPIFGGGLAEPPQPTW